MADGKVLIKDLIETTEAKDADYIAIDNGTLTRKISVGNYNNASNQTAKAYAEAAGTSAETAENAISTIDTKIAQAQVQVDAATTAAGNATISASEAAQSAQDSSGYANTAQGYATNAQSSASSATASAENARDNATLARYWANKAQATAGITVDDHLDNTSLNPVENRAITNYLDSMHTGGSNIRIYTEESTLIGEEVHITDGTTVMTGKFDSTGSYTFEGVQMTGTLTITSTDGNQTATDSIVVPYFGNYDKQIAFWAAHVSITTNKSQFNGLSVTVKKDGVAVGSTTFNNGTATYTASSPGVYKFEVTYGWNTWESSALSVTEETDYTTTLNGFICPITVTTPSTEFYGKTVTATSDGQAPTSTLTFDNNGEASYEALEAASYTFTVVYDDVPYSNGVTVSSETAASVAVKYWTANVNVTTPTSQMYGLTVTAKDASGNTVGTTTFSSSGAASFALHSEGTYHFECVLGWRTFSSDAVSVTAETTYSTTIQGFVATIQITSKSTELALADVTITCSGVPTSTVKLPVMIPGSVNYTAYKEGTYHLSTTYDGKEFTDDVEVTEQTTYTAKIDTHNDVCFAFHYSENDSSPASVTYPEGYTNSGYTGFQMNLSTGVPDYGSWNPKGDNADDVSWLFPRSCMLKYDGTVDYYLNEDDETKKEDGTASDVANSSYAGNAMMEWGQDEDNPIYWKVVPDSDNKGFTFVCANYEHDEDMKPWNHYNCKGEVAKHFYLPKYFGSSDGTRLRSISGGTNYVNNQATTELSLAKKNNLTSDEIWNTEVAVDWIFLYLVCCLISKNMNTQAAFGSGRSASGNTSAIGQGTMNGKGLFYGKNNGTEGVKVFGMENPWGNLWRRIAGLMYVSGQIRLKLTYTQLDGSTVDGYNTTGNGYKTIGAISGTNGGFTNHAYSDKNYILPAVASGSETTYYADGAWFNASQVDYALVGGDWHFAGRVGGFCCTLSDAVSYASTNVGAAVSCKPLA